MKKCLLWGMGHCLFENINLLKYHEMKEHFRVVGVTAKTSIYSEMGGYCYIDKNDICNIEFDFVIVLAYAPEILESILQDIKDYRISDEIVFTYNILKNPVFDIEKILQLRKNPPSIIACNCWGGYTYHNLGLPFTSPFINMYESDEDYIKIVENLSMYMNEELELIQMQYYGLSKSDYPVVKCGDVKLNFLHYSSFEHAKYCWEKRKKRLNWDNLFIMMYTKNLEIAERFVRLPYEKKICFVPFPTEHKSLMYVDFAGRKELEKVPFDVIVNGMANGAYPYYDPFDLLINGRISKSV